MKRIYLIFLLCFLGMHCGLAQAVLKAYVTTSILGKNQETEYKLVVENAGKVQQIVPPAFKNFELVSGPATESGFEDNNGVVRKYAGYSWRIRPTKTGKLTIAAGSAKADGKWLKSNDVQVQVTEADASNSNAQASPLSALDDFMLPTQSATTDYVLASGEDLNKKIERNIFLRVETDKKAVFAGEPVVVTYKLYTRLKSASNIVKSPAFNGFSVVDIEPASSGNYRVEKLNEIDYNVYLIRKAQLYAMTPGVQVLESAVVENDVEFIKAEYINDPRPSEAAYVKEKITLTSKPLQLLVKPLPGADSVKDFTGAVGSFNIAAYTPQLQFTTDDAGELTVTITGAGNLLLVSAPTIKWPAALEVLEPTVADTINRLLVPVSGVKSWRYVFTASQPGQYQLPGISLVYFNPATSRFITTTTSDLLFTISKGTGKKAAPVSGVALSSAQRSILQNRWLFIISVGLLICCGLAIWLYAERRKKNKLPTKIEITSAVHHVQQVASMPVTWQSEMRIEDEITDKEWMALLYADTKNTEEMQAMQQHQHDQVALFLQKLNALRYTPLDTHISRLSLLQEAKAIFA